MALDTRFARTTGTRPKVTTDLPNAVLRTPSELANIVAVFASSDEWVGRVRLRADRRWYERLYHGPDYDVWVISWLPGQSTGFHDHGASAGAFVVTTGVLEEHRPDGRAQVVHADKPRAFGPDYTHDVRNVSLAPAISIHAYSPPLSEMNEYDFDDGQLIPRSSSTEQVKKVNGGLRKRNRKPAKRATVSRVEQVLGAARARLERLSPEDAFEAVEQDKAVLVDIRPSEQRAIEGAIEGALIVERNVLEWRFDQTSSARLRAVADHDLQVIVFCSEGYASSLAAAALQDLGVWRATDVVGGFHAWRKTGLPTLPPSEISKG
jgi:rhodanese-related sulfurtransferase/predicted metal-dependent enzyme (double-stranded beta helix superfamily)